MSISITWHVTYSYYHCLFLPFPFSGQWNSRIWCEALRKLQRIADVYELVVETGMLNLKTAGMPWISWWISWWFNGNLDWNHHEITMKSPSFVGYIWIHSDRAVKPMRARRLSQRCRVAVWFGFCRKFMNLSKVMIFMIIAILARVMLMIIYGYKSKWLQIWSSSFSKVNIWRNELDPMWSDVPNSCQDEDWSWTDLGEKRWTARSQLFLGVAMMVPKPQPLPAVVLLWQWFSHCDPNWTSWSA